MGLPDLPHTVPFNCGEEIRINRALVFDLSINSPLCTSRNSQRFGRFVYYLQTKRVGRAKKIPGTAMTTEQRLTHRQ